MKKHEPHLSWALSKFPFDKHRVIKNSPWSTVYRLDNIRSKASAYLKIEHLSECIDYVISPILSTYFPYHLPRHIAVNPHLRCQVMHDLLPTKKKPKLDEVLAVYSKIQLQNYNNDLSFLQTTSPRAVLNYFFPDNRGGCSAHPSDLSKFFAGSERIEVEKRFEINRGRVEFLFSFLEVLPTFLSHNDLHINNISFDSNGNLVIYDWSDSVIGPAGSCLASLIGVRSLYMILTTEKNWDAEPVTRYLVHLLNCDLTRTSRYALIASGLLGAFNSILLLTKIQSTDPQFIKFATGAVRGSVASILSVIDDKTLYY